MERLPKQIAWIIWGALTGSILVYVVVLQQAAVKPSEEDAGLKWILYGLGAFFFALSQAIKILVGSLRNQDGSRKIPAWIDQAFVIALALAESPAILGLVLGFQGAPLKDSLALFVLAVIGLVLVAPRFFYPPGSHPEA